MSGKKSTAATVEVRTAKVAELLVDGWSRARICEYARETARWDVSDAQVDRYIAKARERIQADCSRDRKASYALAEARLEALYGKAVDADDLRLALSIVKEQRTLQGLDGAMHASERPENIMFYATMSAYADALRANVPERYLKAVVRATSDLPVFGEIALQDDRDPMAQCVKDLRTLSRTRTRRELLEDGFLNDDADMILP